MSDAKQQGEGSSEGGSPPGSEHGAPERAKYFTIPDVPNDHDRCAFCGQILPKAVSPQAWAKMLRDLAALPGGDPEIAALARARADEIDPPLPVPDAAWRIVTGTEDVSDVVAEIRAAMPFWAPDVIAERIGRYVKAYGEPLLQALYKELTVEQRAALGLGGTHETR